MSEEKKLSANEYIKTRSNYLRGTIAEGAELVIEIVPLLAECSDCHSRFAPADSQLKCPECGSEKVEIVEGREAYVESVDVE